MQRKHINPYVFLLLWAGWGFGQDQPTSPSRHTIVADGYITAAASPRELRVGLLQVFVDKDTKCQLLQADSLSLFASTRMRPVGFWIMYAARQQSTNLFRRFAATNSVTVSCASMHFSVGDRVHAEGIEGAPGLLRASRLLLLTLDWHQRIEGQTLLEKPPQPQAETADQAKELWIDGYPAAITSQSAVFESPIGTTLSSTLLPDGTLALATPAGGKPRRLSAQDGNGLSGMWGRWAAYVIAATHNTATVAELTLWNNEIDSHHQKYLDDNSPTLEAVSRAAGRPNFIKVGDTRIEIIPDKNAQALATAVGMSVLRPDPIDLANNAFPMTKFKFYVVEPFRMPKHIHVASFDGSLTYCVEPQYPCTIHQPGVGVKVDKIIGFPDGTVLIPDCVLPRLHSEAQFAALLSNAIVQVVEQVGYQTSQIESYHGHVSLNNETNGMDNRKFLFDYSVRINEQVIRLGILHLFSAGYDIREAPYVWALQRGIPQNNPVLNSKDPQADVPWYTAYAFDYISRYYNDVEYSKLKRGDTEYTQFLKHLREVDPHAFVDEKQN